MINGFVNIPVDVAVGAILPFAGTRAFTKGSQQCCGGWLAHAEGSGQYWLTKPGIYKVDFSAVVTAAAAGDVSLALNVNGEALAGAQMAETITAAGLANLGTTALVAVPCGASVILSVANTSGAEITVNNASIVITRLC